MDFCPELINATIPNTSLLWASAFHSQPMRTLKSSSYLRPDVGGALLPWIYTAIVIVAHIPTVVIRVVQWEKVQVWCLAATLLTVAVYLQAYISTGLKAEQVLTWTPLVLLIDAGSMLQIAVLVEEAGWLLGRIGLVFAGWRQGLMRRGWVIVIAGWWRALRRRGEDRETEMELIPAAPPEPEEGPRRQPLRQDFRFWVAMTSLALFFAVIVLQVFGLVKAVGHHSGQAPSVAWCSPIFQPFGIAVLDGNCSVHAVDQSFNKGIGCIHIPGLQQKGWIKGTVIGIAISLVLEVGDALILFLVNSNTRWSKAKMRHPVLWEPVCGSIAARHHPASGAGDGYTWRSLAVCRDADGAGDAGDSDWVERWVVFELGAGVLWSVS